LKIEEHAKVRPIQSTFTMEMMQSPSYNMMKLGRIQTLIHPWRSYEGSTKKSRPKNCQHHGWNGKNGREWYL